MGRGLSIILGILVLGLVDFSQMGGQGAADRTTTIVHEVFKDRTCDKHHEVILFQFGELVILQRDTIIVVVTTIILVIVLSLFKILTS